MSFIFGPIRPSVTPYVAESPGMLPFRQPCADLVHVNDLLDIQLQALNDEHYPTCCLPGRCKCCGCFKLVTYLGIDLLEEPGFEALGRQKLQVCLPPPFIHH